MNNNKNYNNNINNNISKNFEKRASRNEIKTRQKMIEQTHNKKNNICTEWQRFHRNFWTFDFYIGLNFGITFANNSKKTIPNQKYILIPDEISLLIVLILVLLFCYSRIVRFPFKYLYSFAVFSLLSIFIDVCAQNNIRLTSSEICAAFYDWYQKLLDINIKITIKQKSKRNNQMILVNALRELIFWHRVKIIVCFVWFMEKFMDKTWIVNNNLMWSK